MINRRDFIQNTALFGGSALLLSHLFTSCGSTKLKPINLPTDAPYNMEYLSGNVGYFTERGGTILWKAGRKGIAVVDTQFPDQARNLISQLQKLSNKSIDAVINTHHHGDHTAGNSAFKDLTDTIFAHENSRENQKKTAESRGTSDMVWLPNRTFKNNIEHVVDEEVIAMNYYGPGHTDGDIVVHFTDNNVVHVGDLVFNRRPPYIDIGAGADIANWIDVLDSILKKYSDDATFVWGHAANNYDIKGNKEDIKAFQNYLEKLLEYGRKCIADGKTAEEVIASTTSIPGAPEWKGKGLSRSINAVYQELNPQ